MSKLLSSGAAVLVLTLAALSQTTVPMNGSCVVTYNVDGSSNLVCTTSTVVPMSPVTVSIYPTSASVQTGGQVQFTATLTGTGNQGIAWSATAGSVSNAGLFTAPAAPGMVTVTAASTAYPSVYASATVTVTSGGGGGGGSAPTFTGNYCTGATGCTLSNVAAGDLLIIGSHQAFPPYDLTSPQTISDSQGEPSVFDAINLGAGLQTWHISPVIHAGAHTITVTGFGNGDMYVAEFSGVASGNPIEAINQNFFKSSSTDIVQITTQSANDLLFGFGRSAPGGSQSGTGFTAIRTSPTMEFAVAATPGVQTVAIQPLDYVGNSVGIQALAIRPSGSTPPVPGTPTFTGNFCVQNGGACTLNNVVPGDMIVVSSVWHSTPTDACSISDNTGESIVVDRQNDSATTIYGMLGLATWHISNVVHRGTHVISANGGGGSCWSQYSLEAFEFANQNGSNPIDAVSHATGNAPSTATTSAVTSQGSDLIYAFCAVTDNATSETGDGFASITVFPTVEYRTAAASPGSESAACPTIGNWIIQELAIKH